MRSYAIAVFLIVFGATTGMVNEMNVLEIDAPTHNINFGEDDIWEIQQGTTTGTVDPLFSVSLGFTVGKIVFQGILCALTIIPLLTEWGVPLVIAVGLQTPIWFIYGFEMLCWFKGTSSKGVG
jgi:hypothetical protein